MAPFRRHEIAAKPLCRCANLFNKIEQCRRIATRHHKLAVNRPAFIQLASMRLRPRVNGRKASVRGGSRPIQLTARDRRAGFPASPPAVQDRLR